MPDRLIVMPDRLLRHARPDRASQIAGQEIAGQAGNDEKTAGNDDSTRQ